MKTLLLIGLIGAVSFSYASSPETVTTAAAPTATQSQGDKELTWVDEQIQAILPARSGVAEGFINSLKDPMKLKKPVLAGPGGSKLLPPPRLGASGLLTPPKVVEEPLRLQAVMNRSALINKKWYTLNDPVRHYTLAEIKSTSVLLRDKKNQQLILFLTKPNNNIQITTK